MTETTDKLTRRRLLGLSSLAGAVCLGMGPNISFGQNEGRGQKGGKGTGQGVRQRPQDGSGGSAGGTNGRRNSSGTGSDTLRVVDLNPNSPNAVALGYSADHQRVDTRRWTKKAGDKGTNQRCATCSIYRSIDDKGGSCSIFSGKRVSANGWCNAWTGH